MSDAARKNLKVSREGIVLIKSFEGFRPRAIQRENGGWVIGYGHTLSAREGATVSEGDAELLLRYDLLPVEKSVNETVPGDLNQHQFDALVSFAFSVGVEDFAGSDVRRRLAAGSPGEAADAMMGWPEPALPETALRRRAAERALFVADPAAPVALSDLLAAPLPPPAVVVPFEELPTDAVVVPTFGAPAADPIAATPGAVIEEPVVEDPTTEVAAPVDPRGAAVAALLGETPARIVQPDEPEALTAVEAEPAEVETAAPVPFPSNDNPARDEASDLLPTAVEDAPAETPEPEATDTPTQPETSDEVVAVDEVVTASEPDLPSEPVPEAPAAADALNAHRYSPYGAMMLGPLPYLQPSADQTPAEPDSRSIDRVAFDTPVVPVAEIEPTPAEPPVGDIEQLTIASTPVVYVSEPVDPAPVAELVLTPPEDAPEPAVERPLWTPEQRDAPDGSETNLFGEDLALTGGGSILRGDIEFEPPARFDWKETGPFIFMGGVGLVSFGASMAAFRRAAEQSGGSELTIIGWVLALIGLACVGVSSINLYRRFGLPGGD